MKLETEDGSGDYPVSFCPVCGSDDITSAGIYDALHGDMSREDITCRVCNWRLLVYMVEKGALEFEVRKDLLCVHKVPLRLTCADCDKDGEEPDEL